MILAPERLYLVVLKPPSFPIKEQALSGYETIKVVGIGVFEVAIALRTENVAIIIAME